MRRALIASTLLLLLNSSAHATGMLIPTEVNLPPLALVNQKVTVNIDDQAAVTKIEQTFRNHTNRALEATYLFPVPKGASVRKFSMMVNGKEEVGEIVEADIARKIYTDVVARTQDPGLLEYMNNSLIKVRVFPIPANGDQKISLSYTSVAGSDNGLVEYVYPMKTDGKAAQTLENHAITIKLKSQHSLTNIYSPSHSITINRPNDREAVIGFEKNTAILDRDFQLYYQPGSKDIGLTAATHRPIADKHGYFMMLLSPRAELAKTQQVPRDFVFVIDTSGSMRGKRLTQAKAALKYCVKNLAAEDRFAMINFASTVHKHTDSLQTASPGNLESALRWVDNLEATGGTAIDDALKAALGMRSTADDGRTYTMVFFTDGQPTWGERDPQKIMANVKKNNTGNTRIFSFGVGDDVNTVLLDGLADTTKAVSTYVRETEDIEAKVSSLYGKISNPVLANLKLTPGEGVTFNEIYPAELPDLFHGNQLVVFGRFNGKGHTVVKLTGTVGKKTQEFVYELNFPAKTGDEKSFVEDLWARRKVGFLLDQIRVQGETKEVKDEVILLAKRHGITTPYTSYLFVPDAPAPATKTTKLNGGQRGVGATGGGGVNPGMGMGGMPGMGGMGMGGMGGPRGYYSAPIPLALQPPAPDAGKGPKGGPAGVPVPVTPGITTTSPSSNAPPISVADFAKKQLEKGVAAERDKQEVARLTEDEKKGDGKDKEKAQDALDQRSSLEKAKHAFLKRDLDVVQQGKAAVDFAVQNNGLRNQSQLTASASRFVQNRNVVEVGGIWIDDGFNPKMETVTIKATSKAYFRLLERRPELKDVYQLGNYVIWVTPSGKALIIDRNTGLEAISDADIDRLFVAPPKTAKGWFNR